MVEIKDLARGSMMWVSICQCPAPSIRAASMISFGIDLLSVHAGKGDADLSISILSQVLSRLLRPENRSPGVHHEAT